MGRKKKPGFESQKMLSSRVELSDYIKFEEAVQPDYGASRIKVQEVLNAFVRSCISGSIKLSGSMFVGGDQS